MVRRVPGAREAGQAEHLRADDVHVLLGHGSELAPERVELVAVEPARACLEPGRVNQVRRADLGDVHLQVRVLADEHARRACVVEVDVREQQVPDVAQLEPALGQARLQRGNAGGGAAVVERETVVRLEQVAADHPLAAEVQEVDRVALGHDPILCAAYAGAAVLVRRTASTDAAASTTASESDEQPGRERRPVGSLRRRSPSPGNRPGRASA